jgi:4-amino-4-deoxy-L-arabinose transferase-like glycosyltransferase
VAEAHEEAGRIVTDGHDLVVTENPSQTTGEDGSEQVAARWRPWTVVPVVLPKWVRYVLIVGVVIGIALGAFLRIWALGREPVNADEAVVGLMAHEILHGHFSAFYWGQNYGGAEPYVVALVFALVGQSAFSLGLTPVLLAAIAAILTWRIGRRLFTPQIAIAAGLVAWVWPEVFIWQSTLEYGFRFAVLDVGLGAVLCTLDLLSRPPGLRRRIDATAIGLLLGVGWWASPEIAYFAIPIIFIILVDLVRRRLLVTVTEFALALVTFVVGALPWIVANIASGAASLHSGPQPDPSFTSHLETLRQHVVPIYLGLALPVSGRFVVPHELGRLLEVVALVLALAICAALVVFKRGIVVVAMVVIFPVVFAASPATWFWQDGRYAINIVPADALLAAAGTDALVDAIARRRRVGIRVDSGVARALALTLIVVLAGVVTVVDARLIAPFRPGSPTGPSATWTSWHTDATGYASTLSNELVTAGIHDVISGYWVATSLTFVSNGTVTASDVRYDRRPEYLAQIERAHFAYLFVRPTRAAAVANVVGSTLLDPGCAVASDRCLTSGTLLTFLARRGIAARVIEIGDFEVVRPATWVSPDAVFRFAGIPR